MTKAMQDVLFALSSALDNNLIPDLDEKAIKEANDQAVLSLICNNKQIRPYIANNVKLMWEQQYLSTILCDVPYFILKGPSASIYYPEPIRRTIGDIDIIVSPSFFTDAYFTLKGAGYTETARDDRHIDFVRNGVTIELHRKFATLKTFKQEQTFDEWIYSATPIMAGFDNFKFPMLPDHLNGLSLLIHINQHLEGGLGLRHFVDWIMFVKHSLPDVEWPSFKEKTDQLGLTVLAKVSTRFGQKFLNMNKEIVWCLDADEDAVNMLMEYIYECGNFGHKDMNNNTMIMVMSHSKGVKGFFYNLQRRGLKNWKHVQKYSCLRPVAWFYQLLRYISLGIEKGGLKSISNIVIYNKKRNLLLDKLGVTRLEVKK